MNKGGDNFSYSQIEPKFAERSRENGRQINIGRIAANGIGMPG